jgi:hypothetical protein
MGVENPSRNPLGIDFDDEGRITNIDVKSKKPNTVDLTLISAAMLANLDLMNEKIVEGDDEGFKTS